MGEPTAYRLGVGIVLFNPQGLVFMGHRVDERRPPWQMPQGGLGPGERPESAALRELAEEVGTDKAEIVGILPDWLHYDYPARNSARRADRFAGQRHKWLLLRYLGTDLDIDIETEHPEFRDWAWVPLAEATDRVVAFKRPVYREVAAAFQPMIETLIGAPCVSLGRGPVDLARPCLA